MVLDKNLMLDFYEQLYLIRRFEEKVYQLLIDGVVLGSVHLCIGEEATAVGTIAALDSDDYIMPTHRGHGQHLARGADPDRLMAEIAGKETGYCKGNSGSIHIFDKEHNNLGANGIVGGQFPIAVGVGLALKYKQSSNCVAVFFGDGATNQGWFFELLNLASLWELPIIMVCTNNLYGMGTPYNRTSLVEVNEKPRLFKIRSEVADGNDVEDVYMKMRDMAAMVKSEKKPALLECRTYRWMGHSAFDQRNYRPKEEIDMWKSMDPIRIVEERLLGSGVNKDFMVDLKDKINHRVEAAAKFALESKYPVFDQSMEL